ncbi:flavin reductase family protein [Arthrobacter sp. H-02-3]|uniref:flavin reductase family protein n=1 Tax=Arthrobacter sp. H-02-3 TaxID=2703675 RepID=UPI00268A9677
MNILPAQHPHPSAQFTRSGTDNFADVDSSPSALGNQVLDGAFAWVDCGLSQESDGGYTIRIGGVPTLRARDDGGQLIFFNGGCYVGIHSGAGLLESVA